MNSNNTSVIPREFLAQPREFIGDTSALSPDGRWLYAKDAVATASLWDLDASDPKTDRITLHEPKTILTWHHESQIGSDSRWLLSEATDACVVWDLKSDKIADSSRLLEDSGSANTDIRPAFSNDGCYVVFGIGDIVRTWDLSSPGSSVGKAAELATGDAIGRVAISSRWLAFATRDPNKIFLSEWSSGTSQSLSLEYSGDIVWKLQFTADGRWLFAQGGGGLLLWAVDGAQPSVQPIVVAGDTQVNGSAVAVSADGQWLMMAGIDRDLRVWDLKSADPLGSERKWRGHEGFVSSVALGPEGRWAASYSTGQLTLWDLSVPDPAQSRTAVPYDDRLVLPNPQPGLTLAGSLRSMAFHPFVPAIEAKPGKVSVWHSASGC